MSHHNHFFFFRTILNSLRYADWKEAAQRSGIVGLVIEFFRALSGLNAWPFFVAADSGTEPATIHSILNAHGIVHWGWGKHNGEFFFQVKLRHANWAQYLLQQHGVPLSGQLLDEGGRSAYRPASRRTLRSTPSVTPGHGPAVPVTKSEATTSLLTDPVGQINRAVDRLAKW